jgi:hypothetical protein
LRYTLANLPFEIKENTGAFFIKKTADLTGCRPFSINRKINCGPYPKSRGGTMDIPKLPAAIYVFAFAMCVASSSTQATIITGTISDWVESSDPLTIGDGTNHVTILWSVNTFDKGWFYGSGRTHRGQAGSVS